MSTGNAIELTRDLIRFNAEMGKIEKEIQSLQLKIEQKSDSLKHNQALLELAKDKPMKNDDRIAMHRYADRVNVEASELSRLIIRNTDLNRQKVELIGKIVETQAVLKVTLDDQKYQVKDSSVHLTDPLKTVADALGDELFSLTNKTLVITDGVRGAAEQARIMYDNIHDHNVDPVKLYKNKSAAQDIKDAYNDHRDSKSDAISAMTRVIQAQIDSGVYLSAHLRDSGMDLRDYDLSAVEKATLTEIIGKYKELSLLKEGSPPHFHVQVAVNKLKVEPVPVVDSKAEDSGPKIR